ncbi:MAG TPA: prepilin-type N-terminal cleavage/methylation domain-containing protein [Candidatus Saccharibacteria bacterium]|nr:prepilin-type N-terminal cleavage/methylation domain-containing protein [Candidatus Saccharibacteria bacterium]HRK94164.1 prepilin-type N-terminal cleavage/methylation domain-containing protein [Candidatus Saccharibacteria bacterium]
MNELRTTQSGYTLIELLMYVVIISALLTSITYFFGITIEARAKNQTIAEVNDQGAAAMDYITQTIRNGTSITAPTTGASANSLTLVVPTGSLSPTIFNLSGTTLQVKEGSANPVAITSSDVRVTSLAFTNLTRSGTPGIVRVSFTLSHTNPSNRNEYDYQKTFTSSAEVSW